VTVRDETGGTLTAAAELQRRLWSADPEGWALYSEPHNLNLFEAVLDAAGVTQGVDHLDVACGTGLVVQLAAARGASAHGIDISPGLLAVAARRCPDADLVVGDMQLLPFANDSFDAVTGINAFQFAADPVAAIAEAARVCRPGGRIAVGMFAEPERAQSTAIHVAMSAFIPPEREHEHEPYALSAPGNLEASLAAAGLEVADAGEVVCDWSYANVANAVRGLIGSAGGTRAVEAAGFDVVSDAITSALVPFTNPDTGGVVMRNVFRWIGAVKL
jgi:SAM-dependent methyltransferase